MPTDRLGPEVVLDIEPRGAAWLLVLANTGDSTAYQPRVRFDGPVSGLRGQVQIDRLPVWGGLALLRPGHQIEVLLDAHTDRPTRRLRAVVTWAAADGSSVERRFDHDLSVYDGLPTAL
jgi:hypothetical protein